jgi:L1 cell adhesion molecule like protein
MPPEYILEGALSTKYDVYSFGIILLETMNGMCSESEPARGQASVEWVS